jgi:uncharacterized protein
MRFWDSSALLPLLIAEPATAIILGILKTNHVMAVWWGSPGECVSALARIERDGNLAPASMRAALQRLESLRALWHEVAPSETLRLTAIRLLRVHALRAADAFQLAAALVASEQTPASLDFVCLDKRLLAAASKEGFRIIPE